MLGQLGGLFTVVSAGGPARAGVMMAGYWRVRKGRPQNGRGRDGFSLPGLAGLAAGIAVGVVTGGTFALVPGLEFLDMPFFIGPVNGIVVSMVVYVVVYKLAKLPAFPGTIQLIANRE